MKSDPSLMVEDRQQQAEADRNIECAFEQLVEWAATEAVGIEEPTSGSTLTLVSRGGPFR